jgi:hypothetical protein
VAALRRVCHGFDAQAHARKHAALARLAELELRPDATLVIYHGLLLFLRAHPSDPGMLKRVEAEFARVAALLKGRRGRTGPVLENQGLPWADTVTRFTHDCTRWLLAHPHGRIAIDGFEEPKIDLNAVLRLTLPTLERAATSAGLENDELLDALSVRKAQRLPFIVNELARFDDQPGVKDQVFDALDLFVRVAPTHRAFSKAYNRLPMPAVHYQRELLRSFDPMALMNQRLPAPRKLDAAARAQAIQTVKNSLALTARETDTATYLDPESLWVVDLDHGLAVAIYGMVPPRQLPLESYLGFTLFKNGLAAAYGGAWLLGPRADFGMNIFEPYRGGESGFMMCQVLRAYRQRFGVRLFEVDAHQFGLDNPEGIATGAFWFYWRHGFRPLDGALARRAAAERLRATKRPGYRSSEKTLLAFTASNVALNFGGTRTMPLADITARVTQMMQRRYRGDRINGERDCISRFERKAGALRGLNADEQAVLTDVAVVAEALAIRDAARLALLKRMVRAKPRDVARYQKLLVDFFAEGTTA